MSKTCLVILYSNSDASHIDVLKKRYENKFDKVYHLVPLYHGEEENVIPVFENPIQMTGYIAQSYREIYSKEYSHYVFMFDDCVLNPEVNSNNLCECFGIDENTCFISDNIYALDEDTIANEPWALPSLYNHVYSRNGAEIAEYTYKKLEARQKYMEFGVSTKKIRIHYIQYLFNHLINGRFQRDEFDYKLDYGNLNPKTLTAAYKVPENNDTIATVYPFVYSEAEFFIIPNKTLKSFAYYLGIYAAVRVHYNIGFATSLCFSAEKISTLNKLPKDKSIMNLIQCKKNGHMEEFMDYYNSNVDNLIANMKKKQTLVIYPINDKEWASSVKGKNE